MKPKSMLLMVSSVLLVLACADQPPRKDFDPKRKIQTISVASRSHVYAQDDVLLTRSSVDRELSKMNDQWKEELSTSNAYYKGGVATFITEVVALGVCLAQNSLANVLGWCTGSVGMGVATYIFWEKADEHRFRAVDQYNQAPQAGIKSVLEQEYTAR